MDMTERILIAAREVFNNPNLRPCDIFDWEIVLSSGERYVTAFVPDEELCITVSRAKDKRAAK